MGTQKVSGRSFRQNSTCLLPLDKAGVFDLDLDALLLERAQVAALHQAHILEHPAALENQGASEIRLLGD